MARYVTSTTPPLTLIWAGQQVVLDCESEPETPAKRLYPKPGEAYEFAKAAAVFNSVKAQYEQRRKVEAQG